MTADTWWITMGLKYEVNEEYVAKFVLKLLTC